MWEINWQKTIGWNKNISTNLYKIAYIIKK
jgi:hypothetical protein